MSIIYLTGIHPIRIADGFELAAQAANENLDKIADKFDLDPSNPENLIQTAMVRRATNLISIVHYSLTYVEMSLLSTMFFLSIDDVGLKNYQQMPPADG